MEKEIIKHIRKKNKKYLKKYEKRKFKVATYNWYSIWRKVVLRKRIH
jgi:hypothetical protein